MSQALIAAQQRELRRYDGAGDIGPSRDAAMFEPPDGVFLVLRDDDGVAVACGGICRFDEHPAELKRMYVLPAARGRASARPVLEELEAAARRLGYAGVVLETGDPSGPPSASTAPPATGRSPATGSTRCASGAFAWRRFSFRSSADALDRWTSELRLGESAASPSLRAVSLADALDAMA